MPRKMMCNTRQNRSGILKTTLVGFLSLLAASSTSEAKESSLLKDKICLPFGSKELSKIGAENMNVSYITKKEFKFGLATIPPGCHVGFQTTEEQASSYTDEYMESIRSIRFIRCPNGFMLADKLVSFANFDMKGCLEDPLFLQGDIDLCGRTYKDGQELPFKNGKIVCPKPSK